MKTPSSIGLPKVLHYVFLGLSIAGALLLLLNLSAYFGLGGNGPFIRGWVTTVTENNPVAVPHPDGSGDFKMYNFGEQKLVMLEFNNMSAFLQTRYLGYILFQNLAWVLGIIILYQMFRIFRNLDLGATFRSDNTRRIKVIALAVLMFPIVRYLAERLMADITYEAQGHLITTARLPIFTETLALGALLSLVIFALAEVFRSGAQLQQEQDLTI